jgi:hypothetical protein
MFVESRLFIKHCARPVNLWRDATQLLGSRDARGEIDVSAA